jgi:putative FmdB family regulatory protein
MPIFEYLCQDCGARFEKLVRRSDDGASLACPECGKAHLQQELSTFAAHSASPAPKGAPMGGCPAGMCPTPGMCGRNN